MKILSVDDNDENLYLLESMLRGWGYDVSSARNGIEALQKLEHDSFDLIISDILMPRMDGFQLCHHVKQNPAFRDIPFVFYTATYTEKGDMALGLSLGASRFIVKPIEPERFVAIIKEVLDEFTSGSLAIPLTPEQREEALLRAYNQRLVRKLDKKVEDLENLTRELEVATAEGRRARDEVRRLNHQLEERVRRRTAELEASKKDLETFTSSVSHDLRAPLRGISGWAEALAEDYADTFDEQAKSYVAMVRSEASRMGSLIEDLLNLSRSTHQELHRESVNLSDMAVHMSKQLRAQKPERTVNFVIKPGILVQGDPVLLRVVMQNLLENAWKFTAKRADALIEFGAMEHEGTRAYFVRDNGAGFDMKDAAKLFQPFERLHRSIDFPGTGIGLATVHHIVTRHGGRVWAEGAVDKGATFYFTLESIGGAA